MGILICVVTLGAIASLSSAANLSVASSTDEFVAAWQRNIQNDIKVADLKIECVDARGADTIKMMKDQQQELLRAIRRNEERLVPMQSLSLVKRHCVQKYQKLLVSYETAQSQTAACIATAQTRVTNALTTDAKRSVGWAKNNANNDLPKAIASCNTTHYANQTKLEECVTNTLKSHEEDIQSNLRVVDKNLDASLCSNTDLSRDAIKCSFSYEKNVFIAMGNVDTLIDKCINEAESACPCAKTLMVGNETITPSLRTMITGT